MRYLRFIIIAIVVFGLVYASTKASAIVPGDNQRVSLMYNGQQTPSNYGSPESILSADGKKVVFRSQSPNIIQGGGPGIFERDLATGSVIKINVSASGVQQTGDLYIPKAVSSNGRFVLFIAEAPNLIDGQTTDTAHWQLYLRDTLLSTTTIVTKSVTGVISNGSDYPTSLGVSSDGRFIVFTSNATTLDSEAVDGHEHIYRLDTLNNQLSLIDRKTDGSLGMITTSTVPEGGMSCDGSLIAFQYPSNLVVGDNTNPHTNIYLLDLRSGTHLTNLTKDDQATNQWPTISCNGDYVGFVSTASNLDSTYSGYQGQFLPYVFDRMSGKSHLVAIASSGGVPSGVVCSGLSSYAGSGCRIGLSDTGLATFTSSNTSLVGSAVAQAYLTNIYSGTTELLSKSANGDPGDSTMSSEYPRLSRDGTLASYASLASNLVSGDTNSQIDAFISRTGY